MDESCGGVAEEEEDELETGKETEEATVARWRTASGSTGSTNWTTEDWARSAAQVQAKYTQLAAELQSPDVTVRTGHYQRRTAQKLSSFWGGRAITPEGRASSPFRDTWETQAGRTQVRPTSTVAVLAQALQTGAAGGGTAAAPRDACGNSSSSRGKCKSSSSATDARFLMPPPPPQGGFTLNAPERSGGTAAGGGSHSGTKQQRPGAMGGPGGTSVREGASRSAGTCGSGKAHAFMPRFESFGGHRSNMQDGVLHASGSCDGGSSRTFKPGTRVKFESFSVPPKRVPAQHSSLRALSPGVGCRHLQWGRLSDSRRHKSDAGVRMPSAAGVAC